MHLDESFRLHIMADESDMPGTRDKSKEEQEKKICCFLQKGEEVLDTFKMSVRAFESQTLQFKELQETVNVLKLKAANDGEAHPRKQAKLPTRTMQAQKNESFEVTDAAGSDSEEDDISMTNKKVYLKLLTSYLKRKKHWVRLCLKTWPPQSTKL